MKHRIPLLIALLFICAAATSACDSDPDDAAAASATSGPGETGDGDGGDPVVSCDPGAQSGCVCDNGYIGSKTCSEAGDSYGDCVCETCTPNCTGLSCGGDGCGGSCGVCFGDDICASGTCKSNAQCPIEGTGKLLGDQIKNVTFTGAHALPLELHSLCGETKAVWLTLVAGWCTACTTLAPNFQAIHEQFIEEDVEWLLVVGDDGGYKPADWNYAKHYHGSKGYPESWPYVADPGFDGLIDAVQLLDAQGSLYLPAHLILGPDMSIQFISSQETGELDAMAALQTLL